MTSTEYRYYNLLWIKRNIDQMANSECKTIGNCNPVEAHCLTCSFNHIKKLVDLHVEFWQKDNRHERAIS